MNAKLSFLLLTHLLALGLGYGVARYVANADAPGVARLPARERLPDAGDGDDLLIAFMAEQAGRSTRYESLKATLAEAKDLKAAVVSAIHGLGGGDWREGLTEEEQETRLAEVEVRVLHWMRRNPVEVMGFLLNDPTCEAAGLAVLLDRRVFRELATENGVLKSLGWLAKNEASFGTSDMAAGQAEEIPAIIFWAGRDERPRPERAEGGPVRVAGQRRLEFFKERQRKKGTSRRLRSIRRTGSGLAARAAPRRQARGDRH